MPKVPPAVDDRPWDQGTGSDNDGSVNDNTRMLAGRIGPCPTCGNGQLTPVSDGEDTNFLCRDCGACWHVCLGWVDRVNPATCPGCPSRDVCEAARIPYDERYTALR